MLRHLSIRDFVIVAALDLEFDSGFTVFSGETGAGWPIGFALCISFFFLFKF